jgi:uncharacterized protein YjbJ (UPF0337 family)
MSTQQDRVFENWDTLKGKILQRWGQLTDDELMEVEGQLDQLVGLIHQKTGEARNQIKRVLNELSEEYGTTFAQAKETARQYAEQANDAMHDAASQVRDRAREGYDQATDVLRRRPAESVAVAFGTGLLVGVIVGLIARSK